MRRLALLLLASCGFTNTVTGGTAIDASTDDTPRDADPEGTTMTGVGFRRSIDLTDALVTGTHASFPLLIELSGDWLKTEANGGHVANATGSDIRITTDAAGTVS